MNDSLLARLRRELKKPLPGIEAQKRLAPKPGRGWNPPVAGAPREASVLVLLYPEEGDWILPLTRRTDTLAAHRGQISFTGGSRDPGETPEQTALREAHEEIGLAPERVELLGTLTPLHIPRSNFLVTPVVGAVPSRPAFAIHAPEVAEIVLVSLQALLDPGTLEEQTWQLPAGEAQVPFFRVGPHRVWGATAMMLAEFLALVRTDH